MSAYTIRPSSSQQRVGGDQNTGIQTKKHILKASKLSPNFSLEEKPLKAKALIKMENFILENLGKHDPKAIPKEKSEKIMSLLMQYIDRKDKDISDKFAAETISFLKSLPQSAKTKEVIQKIHRKHAEQKWKKQAKHQVEKGQKRNSSSKTPKQEGHTEEVKIGNALFKVEFDSEGNEKERTLVSIDKKPKLLMQ